VITIIIIIIYPLIWLRQLLNLTSMEYVQQQSATQGSNDTANTLSCRTEATIRHRGGRLPETNGTKFCQQSDQARQAFTRWRHQSEVAHIG